MQFGLAHAHPGEILSEIYLEPLGLSAGALARKISVPRTRIERVVGQQSPITTDTAMRLARFFNTTPQFWINLQTAYDVSSVPPELIAEIEKIEPLNTAA
jgi:antitoxin HigA-1